MRNGNNNWIRKHHRKSENRVRFILLGLFIAAVTFFSELGVFAVLIKKGVLPIGSASWIGKGSFAVALLIGCCLSARKGDRARLISAAAAGMSFLVLLCLLVIAGTKNEHIHFGIPIGICAAVIPVSVLITGKNRRHGYR